jgi:thermitase
LKRLRHTLLPTLLYALAWGVSVSAIHAQATGFVPNRLLVKFRSDVASDRIQTVLNSFQARSAEQIPALGIHIVELPPNASEAAFQNAFKQRDEVEFAEFDQIRQHEQMAAVPNDPYYSGAWHLTRIDAPSAWPISTGAGVIVAIADTGVDSTHPDLSPRMLAGWNMTENNSNTQDVYGHGTKVAGTVAAASNNGMGVTSVAWDAWIMPVRISLADGSAYDSTIANGIVWAADHGARVVNVSYYISGGSTISSAARYLYNKGGVVAASAGNYGTLDSYPDDPYILTVGATDPSDVLYSWSNRGAIVDLVAPGCVTTTFVGGGFGGACGTSFSAPVVAGAAALLMAARPGITAADVMKTLTTSADDLGVTGRDTTFGAGRVNAGRAVGTATPTDTQLPAVSISSPTSGAVLTGAAGIQVSASDNVGVTSVVLTANGALVGSLNAAPYTFSWDTAAVANGVYTLTATARDAAGNSKAASISVSVSNTPPDTQEPTVSMISPGAGAVVTGTVSLQVSASDNVGVTSVALTVNGSALGSSTVSPFAFSWNTATAPNGTYTLTATAKDAAGNASSASITVTVSNVPADTQAPMVLITSPAGGAVLSGASAIQVSASDNVAVTSVIVTANGTTVGSATAAPYTFNWNTTTVPNGVYALIATAKDAAGNVQTTSISVSVSNATPDTQSPTVAITSPASGAILSGTAGVQISASDNVGVASVIVTANGAMIGSSAAPPYAFNWNTTAAANGSYTLTATARDAAGNVTSASIIVSISNIVADTQAPTVSFTAPANGASVAGTIVIQLSASDNVGVATVVLAANGAQVGSSAVAPHAFSWNTTAVPNGAYTLTATAKDAAGNTKSSSISLTVNNPIAGGQAFTIALTSPTSGATLKGANVSFSVNWTGAPSKVEYYCDGILVGSSSAAPFSSTWKMGNLSKGVHNLQAKGYDQAGAVTVSPIISVTR